MIILKIIGIIIAIIMILFIYAACKVASSVEHDYEKRFRKDKK